MNIQGYLSVLADSDLFGCLAILSFLAGCSGGADGGSAAGDQPQEAPAATAPAQQGAA